MYVQVAVRRYIYIYIPVLISFIDPSYTCHGHGHGSGTCISRTRSDALGKWKRRCHGCSDVRHDVQRTSLGGQIVETGTMCGLCGWNFEARPATTTGDWKTQANAAQHSGPPLFRLLTHLHNHNNNNETRPTSSPPPLRTRHHFPPCDRRQISHILLHQPLPSSRVLFTRRAW